MNPSVVNYYLFTLVNISEDSGLNGEYENVLFESHEMALDYMEKAIKCEISVYFEKNYNLDDLEVERIDDNMVNLWLNRDCTEAVLYKISEIQPIKNTNPEVCRRQGQRGVTVQR